MNTTGAAAPGPEQGTGSGLGTKRTSDATRRTLFCRDTASGALPLPCTAHARTEAPPPATKTSPPASAGARQCGRFALASLHKTALLGSNFLLCLFVLSRACLGKLIVLVCMKMTSRKRCFAHRVRARPSSAATLTTPASAARRTLPTRDGASGREHRSSSAASYRQPNAAFASGGVRVIVRPAC